MRKFFTKLKSSFLPLRRGGGEVRAGGVNNNMFVNHPLRHFVSLPLVKGEKKILNRGFTFIELIVVITIFALMSTVVLFNFSDFTTNVSLQNLSHDIALRVKEAQSKAIFGQSNMIVTSSQSNGTLQTGYDGIVGQGYNDRKVPSYGVYFATVTNANNGFNSTDEVTGAGSSAFIYFYDDVNSYDGWYTSGQGCGAPANTECLEKVVVQTGDRITDICFDVLSQTDPNCTIKNQEVSITFKRPFPDAIIKDASGGVHTNVRLTLTSTKMHTRTVLITSLGQIIAQ